MRDNKSNLRRLGAEGDDKVDHSRPRKVYCSAVNGSDGTVYSGTEDGYLHAVQPNGTTNWVVETDGPSGLIDTLGMDAATIAKLTNARRRRGILFSADITQDDQILFLRGEHWLYSIGDDGKPNWK